MHSTWKKAVGVAAAAVVLMGAGIGVAAADDISNSLDGTVDATAEVMALNAGGASGTTTLDVMPRNGDGKNGCNLTGSTTLTLGLASSDPGVATVSPSSVTFTSCDDTKTVTVTPVAVGSATISATQTSNTTGGSFNLAPATFTVNVSPAAPANTAPTVSVTGVTPGGSYNVGEVPTATCNVTDTEDGNSSFPATLSAVTGPDFVDGIGSQTASCSYTDAGGLPASSSVTYSIVDPTPPVIAYTLNPAGADGDNGWYTSDVTLTWTVTENESPHSLTTTGCVNQDITADQFATDYSCSASSAGGDAAQQTVTIKRDGTAPTVEVTGPADGGTYTLGSVPGAGCTTSDDTSGVANDATASVSGTGVGSQTATCTGATDNAGNAAADESVTYAVHYSYRGFFAPVDNGVLNTMKAGSAVPVKFSLSGNQGLSIMAAGSPSSHAIDCTSATATDAIETTSTAGQSSLSYDPTADQYVYVWKTDKAWAGTCRQLSVSLVDGTSHTANFKFSK